MLGDWNPVPKPETYKKGNRHYKKIKCKECKKEVEKRSDFKGKYCSSSCSNKANGRNNIGKILEKARKGKYQNCQICNKEFYVTAARLRAHKSIRFCSSKCQGKWQSGQPLPKGFIGVDNSGSKNGRYKNGKRVGEHVTKPKVRDLVKKRDGNWCLLCGVSIKGLHLHRVEYGSQGGKYEKHNCIQLCSRDHELVHSNKRKWQPLLLDYIETATQNETDNEIIEPKDFYWDWKERVQQVFDEEGNRK